MFTNKIDNKSNILKNTLFITVFIIIVAAITLILKYDVISGDDVTLGFFDNYSIYEILYGDHGRYLSNSQQKIFSVLGAIFSIHPQQLINNLGGIIKGFDIALFCLIFSLFPYFSKKTTIFTPLISLITFVFYINQIVYYDFEQIRAVDFHFGYCCGSMLYFAFLLLFGCTLFNKIKLSNILLVFICIFSFLSSLNDTFALTGTFFLIIINIYLLISFLQNNGNFISFLKEYKNILIISLTFIFGAFLAIKGMLNDSHVADFIDKSENSSFIGYWFNMIKLFIPEFYKELILKYWGYLLCILILVISVFKTNKKNNNLNIVFSLSVLLSILLFFISLISGGTETFYIKGKFWISHNDLQLFYVMTLTSIILMLWGFYIKNINERTKLKTISIIIASMILICSLLQTDTTIKIIKNFYKDSKMERIAMYKAEKIYLFYTYRNEQPILPISILSMPGIGSAFWVGMKVSPQTQIIDEYEINKDKKGTDFYNGLEKQIKNINFEDAEYRKKYISKIYGIEKEKLKPYKFENDEIVYEKFIQDGGNFSDDELNIDKLNFNILLDKNFVLNK